MLTDGDGGGAIGRACCFERRWPLVALLAAVQQLLNEQQLAFNLGCVGKTMSILLEREGKEDGQLIGRSPYMQSVHVMAPQHRLGQMVDVEIVSAGANSLKGQILMAQQAA